MARVKDDVDKIWNAMGYVGMLVIEVIIHVSMVLYCMFSLNWKLAFVPLATMILCGTVAIIMERKLDKIYEDISEENAVLTPWRRRILQVCAQSRRLQGKNMRLKNFYPTTTGITN